MQEHPIPQDITGYKFHIIGSMTLKQFGEVLIGVIFAFIFYQTNLIDLIKWPLILLSVGMGAAAAFVPIEERPLDHWIITFFSVMYKPTKFYWKRVPTIPEPFKFEPRSSDQNKEPVLDLTPAKRQRIKEYVSAIPEIKSTTQDYTQEEMNRMQGILSSFTTMPVSQDDIVPKAPIKEKPRIDVRVRKMRKPVVQEEIIFSDMQDVQLPINTIYEDEKPKQHLKSRLKKAVLKSDEVAHNIEIPEEIVIKTTSDADHEEKVNGINTPTNDISTKTYIEPEAINTVANLATQEALYNQDLPFPVKPTQPNKVVGMVLSQNNDLLTDTIVEVQTPEGSIVRAVKTNALGQFFITTPLKTGDYNIVAEKAGYQFEPHHIKIDDTIIQPMEIRSTN